MVAIRDNEDYMRVLVYSYYITTARWGGPPKVQQFRAAGFGASRLVGFRRRRLGGLGFMLFWIFRDWKGFHGFPLYYPPHKRVPPSLLRGNLAR